MRISDWSSDVCSSDLLGREVAVGDLGEGAEAVKTLAAAHGDPGPALQPGETAGGQRACQRGLDLTPRHQLAVADDAAVSLLRPGAPSLFGDPGDIRPRRSRRPGPAAVQQCLPLPPHPNGTARAGPRAAAPPP